MRSKVIYHRSQRCFIAQVAGTKVPKQDNPLARRIRPHLGYPTDAIIEKVRRGKQVLESLHKSEVTIFGNMMRISTK
jgi:hypothetical protein